MSWVDVVGNAYELAANRASVIAFLFRGFGRFNRLLAVSFAGNGKRILAAIRSAPAFEIALDLSPD
jgi:hypothetical protein